jgi:hypothetical protein
MAELKRANKKLGHHWFSEGTMRFFKSQIESELTSEGYFISSERPPHGARAYAVRLAREDGSITTIGKVCEHKTYNDAVAVIKTNQSDAEDFVNNY